MLHGGASNFAGRGIALLVSAITLPLTIRYLGKLEYGVWITISTSVVMFSVLDLGIANTLTNFAIVMVVPQQLEVRRVLRGDFLSAEHRLGSVPKDVIAEEVRL
jgi:hypothetical protein